MTRTFPEIEQLPELMKIQNLKVRLDAALSDKWISMSTMLPNLSERVLVWSEAAQKSFLLYRGYTGWYYLEYYEEGDCDSQTHMGDNWNFTHWMPINKPQK